MSHTKRSFIQAAVLRALPPLEKAASAVEYAEALWEHLTRAGYGAPEARGPRETVDWYAKLDARERKFFDRFWTAYGLKKGRSGAAMRWYQLGDTTDAEYERIIRAASVDARWHRENAPPGQVRIYPQGWLSERRWEDMDIPAAGAGQSVNPGADRAKAQSELTGLRRLFEAAPNDALKAQIERLEEKLRG